MLLFLLLLARFASGAPPGTCVRRCSQKQCVNPTPYAYRNLNSDLSAGEVEERVRHREEVEKSVTTLDERSGSVRSRAAGARRSRRARAHSTRTTGQRMQEEEDASLTRAWYAASEDDDKLTMDQKYGFAPYRPFYPYPVHPAYPFNPWGPYGPRPFCAAGTTCACDSSCQEKGNCCYNYKEQCHPTPPFTPVRVPFVTSFLVYDNSNLCPDTAELVKNELCGRLEKSDIRPTGGKSIECTLTELKDLQACTQYIGGPLGDEQFFYRLDSTVLCTSKPCEPATNLTSAELAIVNDKLVEEAKKLDGHFEAGETIPPINDVYIRGSSKLAQYCNVAAHHDEKCTNTALGACTICNGLPGEPTQAKMIEQGLDVCPEYPIDTVLEGPDEPTPEQIELENMAKATPKLIPLRVINVLQGSTNPGQMFYGNPGIIRGTAGELMKNSGIWPPSEISKINQPGIQGICYNVAMQTADIPNWGTKRENCRLYAKNISKTWTDIMSNQTCPNEVSFAMLDAITDCVTLTSAMNAFCQQLAGCEPKIDSRAPTASPTLKPGRTSEPTQNVIKDLEKIVNQQNTNSYLDLINFFANQKSDPDEVKLDFCHNVKSEFQCSCGLMLCEDTCMFAEGLNCYSYDPFQNIPDNCVFMGCDNMRPDSCKRTWDNSNFTMLTNDEVEGPNTPVKACRSTVKALKTNNSDADFDPHSIDQMLNCHKNGLAQSKSYEHLFSQYSCDTLALQQIAMVSTCIDLWQKLDALCDAMEKCLAVGAPQLVRQQRNTRTKTATVNFRVCKRQKEQVHRFWPKVLAPTTPLLSDIPSDSEAMFGTCVADSDWSGDRAGFRRCENEHKGVMRLSGRELVVCCPGEKVNPFNDGNLGYFGLMPPAEHGSQPAKGFAGKRGYRGVNGVECDDKGCTYYPTCGCPASIPALNVRLTGPRVNLPVVRVPHGQKCATGADCASYHGPRKGIYNPTQNDTLVRITINPEIEKGGKLELYNTFIGNPDSIHIGDNVVLDKWSWTKAWSRELHNNKWSVRSPPTQRFNPFDMQKILIEPVIGVNAYVYQQPIFIGSPGNVWVGAGSEETAIHGSQESAYVRRIKEIATVTNQNAPNY